MDNSYAVCTDALEWVAYGPCGHREVCSTCVICLLFVLEDSRCCICKTNCPSVFITKEATSACVQHGEICCNSTWRCRDLYEFARAGYKEKIWDHAAGVVIIQEAGGMITDAGGRPLDFSRGVYLEGLDRGIIACSGVLLHQRILEAVDAS